MSVDRPTVWDHDPYTGWSPNPTGVPVPRVEPPPGAAEAWRAGRALVARAVRCPHWSPGRSCCDGWSCTLDPDEPRVVSIAADCAACPELPA